MAKPAASKTTRAAAPAATENTNSGDFRQMMLEKSSRQIIGENLVAYKSKGGKLVIVIDPDQTVGQTKGGTDKIAATSGGNWTSLDHFPMVLGRFMILPKKEKKAVAVADIDDSDE